MRWGRRAPRPSPAKPWWRRAVRPPDEPSRRLIMAGAARATSSVRSAPPPVRLLPGLTSAAAPPVGWPSWRKSSFGCRPKRAGLRHPRQAERAPGHGRAAVHAGAPALGDGLPAQVRRLSQPDRAVVEGAALAGPEGPTLRDLGGDRLGRGASDNLLERPPAPLPLGSSASPQGTPPTWHRPRPKSCLTCRMNHQAAISACPHCDSSGYLSVKDKTGAFRAIPCPH